MADQNPEMMDKTFFDKIDELLDGQIAEIGKDVNRLKREETTGKEEISFDKIIDSGLGNPHPKIGGEITDREGNPVAKIEPGFVDGSTFEINVRLVVNKDIWHRVEVVCDGNALDVDTTPMSDGRYKVRKRVNGYKPAVLDIEDIIELPKFKNAKEFMAWVETLDVDTVRALRQIYYDKWNFDSGDENDRMYYVLVDEELQGRKK